MIPSSDIGSVSPADPAATEPHPANWREALMALIASRVALIQLESKDAARATAKRGVMLLAIIGCVFFGWLLLLAGGVAIVANALCWPWSWVAISLASIHLIAALILAKLISKSGNPPFPVTRAEFLKDRQWIENFQNNKKSND